MVPLSLGFSHHARIQGPDLLHLYEYRYLLCSGWIFHLQPPGQTDPISDTRTAIAAARHHSTVTRRAEPALNKTAHKEQY